MEDCELTGTNFLFDPSFYRITFWHLLGARLGIVKVNSLGRRLQLLVQDDIRGLCLVNHPNVVRVRLARGERDDRAATVFERTHCQGEVAVRPKGACDATRKYIHSIEVAL